MVRIVFRSRVDTDLVLHQSGFGYVFLAYQGFGPEESEKTVRTNIFIDFFERFFRDFSTKLKDSPTLGRNMSLNIKLLNFLFSLYLGPIASDL